MADIRINALATTAASTASDDFVAVDGSANGTRKLNAYSPTFGGNLTLGTGSGAIAEYLNRGTTAQSNLVQWQTGGSANWSVGSGATGTGTDLEFYNHNTASSNLKLNYSTGAATLSGNLTVSGIGGVQLNSVANLTWGGSYGAGIPTIAIPSATSIGFYPTGSTSGKTFELFGTGNATLTGNFLIGTTTDGGQKLQVAGTGYLSDSLRVGASWSPLAWGVKAIEVNDAGGGLFAAYYNGTAKGYIVANSGDLAINTQGANSLLLRTNGNTALTLDSSQNATFAKLLGIGGVPVVNSSLILRGLSITVGATQSGIDQQTTFSSSATTAGIGVSSILVTTAASFTMARGVAYQALTPILGAGSSVTTNTGLHVANQGATGITNAYGIDIAAQSGASTTNIGLRNLGATVLLTPASAVTLADNSTMTFELTSNTSLTIKVRGTDGTTRSVALTLA